MRDIKLDPSLLSNLTGKTVILTGGAGGIGATTANLLLEHGATVVIADLESTRPIMETMFKNLPDSIRGRLHFVATNIVNWDQMTALFQSAKARFGSIQLVIANAGVMETEPVLDMDHLDEDGNLKESEAFSSVIDINVKGTMNCLRQAIFSMKGNQPCYPDGSRGAVVLVSSISGYFGGTGVSGYITSKHAVTGMLRGSQLAARKYGIRVNAVAPFVTPTAMAGGFSEAWQDKGLPINTTDGVARALVTLAFNPEENGSCYMVCISLLLTFLFLFFFSFIKKSYRFQVLFFERRNILRSPCWRNGLGRIWHRYSGMRMSFSRVRGDIDCQSESRVVNTVETIKVNWISAVSNTYIGHFLADQICQLDRAYE